MIEARVAVVISVSGVAVVLVEIGAVVSGVLVVVVSVETDTIVPEDVRDELPVVFISMLNVVGVVTRVVALIIALCCPT